MDPGAVQGLGALGYPDKAGALLKGLGPQLGDFQQLAAGGEGPVLLPIGHQVLGGGVGQAGHPHQQRGGCGVGIHPHGVDAVLHHPVQGLTQPCLGHVVLILAHADGLGVDLHQLGQGVLKPPGDGHGGAQIHVELGELLRRQGGGGVHRGPRLTDDHIGQVAPHPADQLHRHLLGLPAGGAVADGDAGDTVATNEGGELGDALLFLPLAVGGIDHRGIQDLARGVHHRHLAAHAIARVQAHGHLALHRGLHEQGLQIQGEHVDGPLVGLLGEGVSDLPLQRGLDEPVIGVVRRSPHKIHAGRPGHHRPPDGDMGCLRVQLQGDF